MKRSDTKARDDQIVARYLADESCRKIAADIGITHQRVYQILIKRRVPKRDHLYHPSSASLLMESCRNEIVAAYTKKKSPSTVVDIARELGMSSRTVSEHLKKWGVSVRLWRIPKSRTDRWVLMYVEKKMSTYEIGHREGYMQSYVHRILVAAGVIIRSASERVRLGKKRSKRVKYRTDGRSTRRR